MTCRISLFKSIRETLKHHIASIFATSLVFFVQFIVFFLNIQNLTHEHVYHSSTDWIRDRLNDIHNLVMDIWSQLFLLPFYSHLTFSVICIPRSRWIFMNRYQSAEKNGFALGFLVPALYS